MARIELVTGMEMPHPDGESHLLVEALEALGADVAVRPWRGPGPAQGDADLVVVRTPWDYPAFRQEFEEWAREVGARTPMHNPPELLAWNGHKGYLLELARAGVPVVPTVVAERGSDPPAVPDEWYEVVAKPAVSSGARGAGRFARGDQGLEAHLRALLADGDVLVQPFAASVVEGERALVFFDGVFSHAVNKRPAAGDYRVQELYGGAVERYEPTPADREAAAAALAAAPGGELLYARVDLVDVDGGPAVMELEAIEPELFLGTSEAVPDRFARAILSRAR